MQIYRGGNRSCDSVRDGISCFRAVVIIDIDPSRQVDVIGAQIWNASRDISGCRGGDIVRRAPALVVVWSYTASAWGNVAITI
jgi:hypothetical protein